MNDAAKPVAFSKGFFGMGPDHAAGRGAAPGSRSRASLRIDRDQFLDERNAVEFGERENTRVQRMPEIVGVNTVKHCRPRGVIRQKLDMPEGGQAVNWPSLDQLTASRRQTRSYPRS